VKVVTSADEWIIVRNWDKFQHYNPAVRTPPWIKAYTSELLHSDEYRSLPWGTRGVLHALWAHYALARGVVPASTQRLSSALGGTVYRHQLKRLVDAGFIEFCASKPEPHGASTTRARERRTEKEKNRTAAEISNGRAPPPANPPPAAAAADTNTALKNLGWTTAQVNRAMQDPARALAWATHARIHAHTNPGALAYTGYQTGEWPTPEPAAVNGPTPTPQKPVYDVIHDFILHACGQYTTNSILDEIELQERRRSETISDQQRKELLEYADQLCPDRDTK
jgi:hypothetical protein